MGAELVANLSSKSALSIQPTAAKAKISNLSQWIEAWNNFLLTTLHFHPHLWPEMLVYQLKICQYASKFPFSLVMQFDMIVRRALSLDMSKRWDECNEDAMDSFLKSDTNVTTSTSTKSTPHLFSCQPIVTQLLPQKNQPAQISHSQASSTRSTPVKFSLPTSNPDQ